MKQAPESLRLSYSLGDMSLSFLDGVLVSVRVGAWVPQVRGAVGTLGRERRAFSRTTNSYVLWAREVIWSIVSSESMLGPTIFHMSS